MNYFIDRVGFLWQGTPDRLTYWCLNGIDKNGDPDWNPEPPPCPKWWARQIDGKLAGEMVAEYQRAAKEKRR